MMRLAMLLLFVALPMTMSALAVDGKFKNLSTLLRQANNRAAAQGRNDEHLSRNLELATPGSGFCTEGGGPNRFVQGNFETVAFATDFGPNCTCSKGGSGPNVTAILAELDMTAATGDDDARAAFVTQFNDELGRFESEAQSTCYNEYETCFEDEEYCGNLEGSQVYKFGLGPGIFTTFDEIAAWRSQNAGPDITLFDILGSFSDLTDELEVDIGFCFTYTKGETGTVCFGIEEDVADDAVEVDCELSYRVVAGNDAACDSCSFNLDTECITASCDVRGMISDIDSCEGTGLAGPFIFLNAYNSPETVTKGSFNALPATEAPVSGPTASAPTAPMTDAPASAPGGENPGGDSSGPMTEAPAPMTDAPTSAPTAPTTEAPASSPGDMDPDRAESSTGTSGASALSSAAVVTSLLAGGLAVATRMLV